MKLYYWKHGTEKRNFGDDLNPWIWERCMPGVLDDNADTIFMGIGTLLNRKYIPAAHKRVIFSSGAGYGHPPQMDDSWKIYCVRGPLTARRLGIPENFALTDGALLVRKFYRPSPDKKHRFSYMPHIIQAYSGGKSWQKVCQRTGIHYIDPQGSVDGILNEISTTECLITEAMHGAIVADCLRVPWIPVKTTERILRFKWEDWCASVGLSYSPCRMMPLWDPQEGGFMRQMRHRLKTQLVMGQLLHIASHAHRNLSDDKKLQILLDELDTRCEMFKKDLKNGLFQIDQKSEKCLK